MSIDQSKVQNTRSFLIKVETDTQVYSPGSGYGTPSTGRGTPNRHLNWAIEVKGNFVETLDFKEDFFEG